MRMSRQRFGIHRKMLCFQRCLWSGRTYKCMWDKLLSLWEQLDYRMLKNLWQACCLWMAHINMPWMLPGDLFCHVWCILLCYWFIYRLSASTAEQESICHVWCLLFPDRFACADVPTLRFVISVFVSVFARTVCQHLLRCVWAAECLTWQGVTFPLCSPTSSCHAM